MIFEEMLREEKQEGKIEGKLEATKEAIFELLEELGEIPEGLRDQIQKIEDLGKLKILFKKAAKAETIRSFEEEVEEYLNSEEEQ